MVSNILTTFPMDLRALECLQPRWLADIQYNSPSRSRPASPSSCRADMDPPPPFFPPTNINYRLGWGELPRERLRWDPVHWISWLSVLVRIWNSMALPFSFHKAWHRLYSSLTRLTGLREPQRRCQFIRLDPRLFHIMLISWTFTLKWSLKIKN